LKQNFRESLFVALTFIYFYIYFSETISADDNDFPYHVVQVSRYTRKLVNYTGTLGRRQSLVKLLYRSWSSCCSYSRLSRGMNSHEFRDRDAKGMGNVLRILGTLSAEFISS